MGDSRRFDEFAKLVARNIPREAHIVDVASGKGYLQAALHQLGYRFVTSWDKRHKNACNRRGYRYGYFDYKTASAEYQAVVAMHPDEGTDHAILYACKHRVPAIVCPCCILPHAEPFWGSYKYPLWLKHLEHLATSRGMRVQWTKLRISGRNDVMIIRP